MNQEDKDENQEGVVKPLRCKATSVKAKTQIVHIPIIYQPENPPVLTLHTPLTLCLPSEDTHTLDEMWGTDTAGPLQTHKYKPAKAHAVQVSL